MPSLESKLKLAKAKVWKVFRNHCQEFSDYQKVSKNIEVL